MRLAWCDRQTRPDHKFDQRFDSVALDLDHVSGRRHSTWRDPCLVKRLGRASELCGELDGRGSYLGELVVAQLKAGGTNVVVEMGDLRGSGDRKHHG